MKNLACALALLASLAPPAQAGIVVLTADEVTSAIDIEDAIAAATGAGSEAGVVVLDGSRGAFSFNGDDRSVNLFHSGLALIGRNGATISGCDDGLVFDPSVALESISVQGITFECVGNAITDLSIASPRRNVLVYANVFSVKKNGIQVQNAERWSIVGNHIRAGTRPIPGDTTTVIAVNLIGGIDSNIALNKLSGFEGVRLDSGASNNHVTKNEIRVYSGPGVLLDETTFGNHVLGNRVSGPPGTLAVEDLGTANSVAGNRVVKRHPH